ncbi:hypothetical protein [Ammoniphilus sp. 3BR4]|uniref:hypothetical protein n=1 Tax=Ammoniphilus sp. 3BR4 TaxID=3158265 RepID=UPI003466D929
MLVQFISVVTFLSFIFLWIFDGFKGYFRSFEQEISQASYMDRLNKEKYLEEVGYNVMNDPW